MTKRFTAVLGTALILAFAGTANAAEKTGKITSIDPIARQIQIETPDGQQMTYQIERDAQIQSTNGEIVQIQQLRPGSQVTLDVNDSGQARTVSGVEVLAAGADTMRTGGTQTQDTEAGMGGDTTVRGEVVSTSGNQITVRTDDGQRTTFRFGSGATVRSNGRDVQLRDLRTGQRVSVTTRQEGSERVASRIEVERSSDSRGMAASDADTERDQMQRNREEHRFAGNLPSTGSPLPLIGMAGAAALGLAGGIRGLRRR